MSAPIPSQASADKTTSKTDTPTESSEPKWHEFHNNPQNDVVLKSRDGILFRASSHALKRESSLFAGMLSSLPNTYLTEVNAIPLDFPSSSLNVFLDCYMTSQYSYEAISHDRLHGYGKLLHYLDCDRLMPPFLSAYIHSRNDKPAEWLYAASRDGNIVQGTAALRKCEARHLRLSNVSDVPAFVAPAHASWRHALLNSLLVMTPLHKGGEVCTIMWPNDSRLGEFAKQVLKDEKEWREPREGA